MLAVNPTIKKAIFSMGKTGTSTLMSVLNDDWYKVGEGDAYFMKEIFKYPMCMAIITLQTKLKH